MMATFYATIAGSLENSSKDWLSWNDQQTASEATWMKDNSYIQDATALMYKLGELFQLCEETFCTDR